MIHSYFELFQMNSEHSLLHVHSCACLSVNSFNSINLRVHKTSNLLLMFFTILFFFTCHATLRTSANTPPHTAQIMSAIINERVGFCLSVDYGKISSLCEALNILFFLSKEPIQREVSINVSTFPK